MHERRHTLWPLLLSALLLFPACDDDSTQPGGSGGTRASADLSGQVTIAYEDIPLAGARVVLVRPLPYDVVAGPVLTGSDGRYAFQEAPAGDWFVFVFGDSVLMLDTDDARVTVGGFGHAIHDITMIRSDLWGTGTHRLQGRVTDALTGDPIQGAYVSALFGIVYHSFVGIETGYEDVTDADGRYSLEAIALIGGNFTVLYPVAASAEGYAPFGMENVPLPMDPDSVYTLDIQLQRLQGTASVHGTVTDTSGRPLADVPVALDFTAIPLDTLHAASPGKGADEPRRVPLLGKTVRSDARGQFEIRGLTPGTYFVDAGFLPDDGWVSAYSERVFEVAGVEKIELGRVVVLPAIRPLSPANGAVIHDTQPVLRWKAVPGTDWYRVSVGTGHALGDLANTTEPQAQFPYQIEPGAHIRWIVTAYRASGNYGDPIAEFEAVQMFTVTE